MSVSNHKLYGIDSKIKHKELTEIVRQAKDNPIISLATDIRSRIESGDFIPLIDLVKPYECKEIQLFAEGSDFMREYFSKHDDKEWFEQDNIIASYTNETVDKYNKAVRKKYWSDKGVSELEYIMENDIVIFQDAHIEDDTIIHNNNDIVTIKSCEKIFDNDICCWYWDCRDEEDLGFKVIDPISRMNYDKYLNMLSSSANRAEKLQKRQIWEQYYRVKGTYQNIKYSYASTVHKLQGSTFEHCYIDMREMRRFYEFQDKSFIYRLLYVAVTRASKDIKILL